MLIQSLFFSVFILVLTGLFSMSSLAALHRVQISHARAEMLVEADRAVERARSAADADMLRIAKEPGTLPLLSSVADWDDPTTSMRTHTAIDAAIVGAAGPAASDRCDVHDVTHACNLSIGATLAEQRIWETIDVRISAVHGETLTLRRHILLRLLRIAPYATVAAVRDDGTGGDGLLGDPAGVPAQVSDTSVAGADPKTFRDTRVHIYQPCRYLSADYAATATDNRKWATWQGGSTASGHQMRCDGDPGETTQYTHLVRDPARLPASPWGH